VSSAFLCNGTSNVEQADYNSYFGFQSYDVSFFDFTVSSYSSCNETVPITNLKVVGGTNWDVFYVGPVVVGPQNIGGASSFAQQVFTTPLPNAKAPLVSLCHLDAAVSSVSVGLGYVNGTSIVTADGLDPSQPTEAVVYGSCSGYIPQTSATGSHTWIVIFFNTTSQQNQIAPNASTNGAGSITWQNGQYYTYTVTGSGSSFNQISLGVSNDSSTTKSSSSGIPWWYWLILAVIILVVVLLVVGAAAGAWFFYQKRKRQTYETIVDARDDSRWDAPA
jgi:hypothetical protein